MAAAQACSVEATSAPLMYDVMHVNSVRLVRSCGLFTNQNNMAGDLAKNYLSFSLTTAHNLVLMFTNHFLD